LHVFFLLYPHFNPPINSYFCANTYLSNKFNMLSFSRNKQLSVIIFFVNKFLYKDYIDETSSYSSSSWSCSCSCFCYLSNESSTIDPSSPLISNSKGLLLFLPFKHSWSFLFFFSQIYSFTLHLKLLTIVTHLIYRILTLLETIVCNKILFKFKDNKKQPFLK